MKYNWHEADVTVLEGVFARGDRRVGKALLEAYRLGCLYDSWSEHFRNDLWLQAFENTGVDIAFYNLRERDLDEILPWDFINIGVTKKFLQREWKMHWKERLHQTAGCSVPDVARQSMEEVFVLKARIKFRKYGVMKFIGHLDIMRFFQKVMRRADIPIAFTGGYSPHMIMSFANPLGVGLTSDGEYFDIELTEPIDFDAAVERMNATMVEGIEVVNMVEISDDKKRTGMSIVAAADYLSFAKNHAFPDDWKEKADIFLDQPQIMIVKKTKKSEKEVDIKPMIYQLKREMKKSTCRLPQEVWKI